MISSLPTYFMPLSKIPIHVTDRLEKLQRDFLWGGTGEASNFHLVDLGKVCSNERGRFGVV